MISSEGDYSFGVPSRFAVYSLYVSRYIPVHFMPLAEFQLDKASSTVEIQTIWGKTGRYAKWMIPF